MQVDIQVAQLLCSRLCHDLVGAVGAVNTGIELISEDAGAMGDALALMARSAGDAARRLAFFRVSFGLGAGADGTGSLVEARRLALGYLEGGKVGLDWPEVLPPGVADAAPADRIKAILNMVLMAAESLPRGGDVQVRPAAIDDGFGVAVTAAGAGAQLKDGVADALALGLADEADAGALTARTVHGYFAQVMARAQGAAIEVGQGPAGEVRLAVLFPT